jgi:hypothetical protein
MVRRGRRFGSVGVASVFRGGGQTSSRLVAGLYRWLRSVLSWAWAWREWQPWVYGVTVVGICGEGGSSNRFCLGDLLFGYVWSKGRFGGCG